MNRIKAFLSLVLNLFCVLFFFLRSGIANELNRNFIRTFQSYHLPRAEALEAGPKEIIAFTTKYRQTAVFFSQALQKDVFLVQRSVYAAWPVKWEDNAKYGFTLANELNSSAYQLIEKGQEVNFVQRLP